MSGHDAPATLPALAEIPGLVHGFTGAARWGTDRDEPRRRAAAAVADAGRLLFLQQVHGSLVQRAPWEGRPEGDAALAEAPGQILAIETADCLPVLLVDPVGGRVAAAHAGWRGSAAGVARAALTALVEAGSAPRDVIAALGPCIGPCCYEVGDELRDAFGAGGAAFFRPGPRGRPHLDLRAANRAQLADGGIAPRHLHDLEACTSCRADLYPSYRRDGPSCGRIVSYVGWRL
jgi:YfiH family protein